jgi:hypothetical protein
LAANNAGQPPRTPSAAAIPDRVLPGRTTQVTGGLAATGAVATGAVATVSRLAGAAGLACVLLLLDLLLLAMLVFAWAG